VKGISKKPVFFRVLVRNEVSGAGATPCAGNKYSLKRACKFCGSGACLEGPLIVKKLKTKEKVVFLSSGEILVDKEVGQFLIDFGIKSLADVVAPLGRSFNFFQVRAEKVLPPFSPKTTGFEKEKHCEQCQRDGYFELPKTQLNLVYENVSDDFFSFNILATYEVFGFSNIRDPFTDSRFAEPILIFSRELTEILQGKILSGVEFIPVDFFR
jgi:hypothetical protein